MKYAIEPHKGYLYASLIIWTVCIIIVFVMMKAGELDLVSYIMFVLIGAFVFSQMAYTHGTITIDKYRSPTKKTLASSMAEQAARPTAKDLGSIPSRGTLE